MKSTPPYLIDSGSEVPRILESEEIDLSGFRMPAEWEPHEATWLAWPCNVETWPDGLEPVRDAWIAMTAALCEGEKVRILVNDETTQAIVQSRVEADCRNPANVRVHIIPNDDAWMRDAGPIFVTGKRMRGVQMIAHDFIFNTWGRKYGPWDLDDAIPRRVAPLACCPVMVHNMVLEGGSIEVNGRGTLLTTKQCLLNPNRNPGLVQRDIEANLRRFFGVTNILWLEEGIDGDDTDGHIDDIARFVNPTTIVAVTEKNENDPNHTILARNVEALRAMRDQDGNPFRIVELPMPDRLEGPFGRSPASYGNFYIANGVVLVPVFSCPNDETALGILRKEFPDRKVIGIECSKVVAGLGAIHCVTQQEPMIP
jgi:agmatine deiminase